MKHICLFVLCLPLLSLSLCAQGAPKQASLSGTVIKEPGDQPLKKVILNLVAEDQKQGGNYTTDTDVEGHFLFENVEPGRYRLLLEKTGFHPINPRGHHTDGAILTVERGQEISGLLFQMLQSAVITGKVVDEDGDPMPSYGVSLLKRYPGKARHPELAAEERTNDLGEYRFSGLFPGQYFVAVVPPPDIRNFGHSRESQRSARADMTYLPTYYPGTNDGTMAAPIDLRAGDELPVNFTMIPSHSFRIHGIVTGISVNQKPIVQLVSRGVIQSMNGSDVATDGQFEIRGVAPGSYTVMVSAQSDSQTLTDRQTVNVVAADVDGVKLVPVRPFTVSGHVTFENNWPKNINDCSAYLRPAGESDDEESSFASSGTTAAQLDRIGNFTWTGVTPGHYVALFNGDVGPNAYLKAVLIGGNDYTTGFNLTGPTSIDLVVGFRGGMVEGTVVDHDKAAGNVTVVAVPEKKYRRAHERFGTASTDQYGHFTIRGLAAGSYTIFAWQDLDATLYYDAAFLKSQEDNGTSIKVEEESRQLLQLKLASVPAEWQ